MCQTPCLIAYVLCFVNRVFIDADKRQYVHYLRDLLGEVADDNATTANARQPLLRPGALVVVDNTLWKGLVLHEDAVSVASAVEHNGVLPDASAFGEAARMRKLAKSMHEFNSFVNAHPALHPLLLPLRDGLSLVLYQPKTDEKSASGYVMT